MSLIWTSAIFFWKDHGNMMSMLPIEEERTYMCTWKGKRVAMRPIPPTTRSIKKRVPSPIYLRNQSDRNSRVSSFEERGIDVGDQRTRQDKQHAK